LNRTKNIFILHLTFKYPNTNKKFKHYYFETFACAKKKKILIHLFLPLLHNCCHYDHISHKKMHQSGFSICQSEGSVEYTPKRELNNWITIKEFRKEKKLTRNQTTMLMNKWWYIS
jgi:hypothetical protein